MTVRLPAVLGLFKSVAVTLTYLRSNHLQLELAEVFGVSQSTISRAIAAIHLSWHGSMRPFTPSLRSCPAMNS